MEGQSSTSNSQYQYQWQRLVRRNTDTASPSSSPSRGGSPQLQQTPLGLLPILLPQQESYHQAQLAHYNKLLVSSTSVSNSARTSSGLQASPLPPQLSAQHIQAVPRSRSNSRAGNTSKLNKSPRVGHGNRDTRKSSKGERALVTERESSFKKTMEKLDLTGKLPNRPIAHHQNSSLSHQSNSVPSTPHQHAREFSFDGDRETSPNATSHSPRSAFSESNIVLPSRPANVLREKERCKFETASAHFKRRMPYNLGTEKLETLNSANIKNKLSKDEERELSTDMRELYDRLLPTPTSEARREELVQKLAKSFNDEWPGHDIRVHVFGSSGNLLCTDESDVDICITTDWKELENVCKIAELLARNGMKKVVCIPNAKVAIVKMWDPKLDLACDMNVNNTLALENTRMIKTYIQIDPRVRELAMIIKYWTKKRILNDAAFGGTLSSYTWICMIINFLQTRNPPVLPNLHNRPHNRLPQKDGLSTFADDLDALRDFGEKNKETVGDLLFGFFRFYGHEFDYGSLVISVRQGAHILKTEKNWHLAANNSLCVEEPFNIGRNLGNTADDTSFRGLHMELRRAFDLISQAKLKECCEQYEIPEVKPTENLFEKPPPAKKLVLRSASQSSRGGRGNRGGVRHSSQHGRNTSGNRRASSGHFENPPGFIPGAAPSLSHQDAWLQRQAQAQLHNDLYTTYSVLQAQENNLRLQLYSQSQQQYLQVQNQAYSQSQGSSQGKSSGTKQQGERNRTSSFDQAPLSAPLPEGMYYYHHPVQYQASMYGYQTSNTNPSSPLLSNAVPDMRRSVHRSSVTNGSNNGVQSVISPRSHSQPASRPNQSHMNMHAASMVNHGLGYYQAPRQANGVPIPRSVTDETVESLVDRSTATASSSPEDNTPKEYVGYYVNDSVLAHPFRQSLMPMQIPAFKQGRRRESQEFAQSLMDRINGRPSRSPSPLGHNKSYSIGIQPAPPTSMHVPQSISSANLKDFNAQAPPAVVRSEIPAPISIPQWQASLCESSVSGDFGLEAGFTSVESSSQFSVGDSDVGGEKVAPLQTIPRDLQSELRLDPPLVVNGSNPPPSESFLDSELSINNGASSISNGFHSGFSHIEYTNGSGSLRSSPNSRNKASRQHTNGGVASLDTMSSQSQMLREDLPHLSPVYENHTPSPRTNRKFDPVLEPRVNSVTAKHVDEPSRSPQVTPNPKAVPNMQQSKPSLTPAKLNGHARGSKSEGGNSNGWQKAGNKKKKGISIESPSSGNGQPLSEKPPRKESERRGG